MPEPDPFVLVVRANFWTNVADAVTVLDGIVNEHTPVPVQVPPPQPVNTNPAAGVGVNVIADPELKFAEHVAPQLIPAGLLLTVPEPDTVTLTGLGAGAKFAPTDNAEFIVTAQAPVPEQAPDQPVNTDPAAGDSVTVTFEPLV